MHWWPRDMKWRSCTSTGTASPARPSKNSSPRRAFGWSAARRNSSRAWDDLAHGASKFALSGLHAAQVARRKFDLASFDAVVAWMPAIAIWPVVSEIERAGIRHRFLFIWDFFPDHHHEIGRIPGGLPLRTARSLEQRLLSKFSTLLCTLEGNADYLRRRFRISAEQQILVTPIWGDPTPAPSSDRDAIRARYSVPADNPIAVFGGQLTQGRGFEQMLAAADAAMSAGSDIRFLFVGDGRLAPAIRERAGRQTNVLYLPPLTRSDYLDLLGACDVGMVATVPGVTSFSIPSKTIDYLRAGLPIVAAVEHGNEFARTLEEYDVGAAVPFGEPELFYRQAARLAARGPVRAAAEHCLKEIFDVRHAVAKLLQVTEPSQSGVLA